jgi:4-hydroxythreonine-4-phosphate dehydrogenase
VKRLRLAVTVGDPRGIGREVVAEAAERFAREEPAVELVVLGDVGPPGAELGDEEAGRIAAEALEAAVELALSGGVSAVVTGPVHKPSLQAAGRDFPGQTEMLRELTGAPVVGMLMSAERTRLGGPLRVLLATTHLPLREVPGRLSASLLVEQTLLLHRSLREGWAIPRPRIGLCALNPHASDGGLFGDEEERVYRPAIERLAGEGVLTGPPLPADTVFRRALEGELDAVVAPYHDVGMAAFKTVAFGGGVNVTLGLPFVRTSPDHGTAFDLAGEGLADPSSMLEALRLGTFIHRNRFDSPVPQA